MFIVVCFSDLNATTFDFCALSSHQSTPVNVKTKATRPDKRRKLASVSAVHGYECDLCQNIFTSKSKVNIHKKRHLNRPKIECEICGKLYASIIAVNEHMIKHKPHEYIRFRCDQPKCNVKFYYKWRHDAHKKLIHCKNPNEFRCEFCHRSLACASSLKRHRLTCPKYKCQLVDRNTI